MGIGPGNHVSDIWRVCGAIPLTESLKAAGYKALFMSVDVPVLGRRLNEMRNDFNLPEDLMFPNILSNGRSEFSHRAGEQNSYGEPMLTFPDH